MSRDFENAVIINLLLFFLYVVCSFSVFSTVSGETIRHLVTVGWSPIFGIISINDPLAGVGIIIDYSYWAFILSTLINLYFIYKITKNKEKIAKNKEPKKEHTYGFGS